MFEAIQAAPADPILGLTEAFQADPRSHKINLGVGVYKDNLGGTPILPSVKAMEQRLVNEQTTKSYLSIDGMPSYALEVQKLLLGAESDILSAGRVQTAAAPGGTGALRIAAEFMRRQLSIKKIHVSNPTWANHHSIFSQAGLEVASYAWFDAQNNALDWTGLQADLANVQAGEAVLLHGCCHNPTGIDPTAEQWQQLADQLAGRGILVVFDFAYQGFGAGVDEDAFSLRTFAQAFDELLVCSSFSKNFGIYNERTGAISLIGKNAEQARTAFSQVRTLIRAIYSNPPAHGIQVVQGILSSTELRSQWLAELAEMRQRIQQMRSDFVAGLVAQGIKQDFSFIAQQNGMFSFSGLTLEQVNRLRDEHGVYIVGNGRISVAGMTPSNLPPLCTAIAQVLAN